MNVPVFKFPPHFRGVSWSFKEKIPSILSEVDGLVLYVWSNYLQGMIPCSHKRLLLPSHKLAHKNRRESLNDKGPLTELHKGEAGKRKSLNPSRGS